MSAASEKRRLMTTSCPAAIRGGHFSLCGKNSEFSASMHVVRLLRNIEVSLRGPASFSHCVTCHWSFKSSRVFKSLRIRRDFVMSQRALRALPGWCQKRISRSETASFRRIKLCCSSKCALSKHFFFFLQGAANRALILLFPGGATEFCA